jgi:hypothetical protein
MAVATPTIAVHDARSLAASQPRFNMVAFHWRGSSPVRYRVRFADGWSPWHVADDDMVGVQHGWHIGNIDWVGTATAVQTRPVAGVRVYTVWSPTDSAPPQRRLEIANAPPIIPRLSWGADESIRRAPPQYAPKLVMAFIHHTAGSNDYTPAESAAIVRGIEIYHVKGNGWNDIGYNFLVDKYGQVFEGRYGGVDKNVIGAHTLGFNTGTVGVAVIGDYTSTTISAAAAKSLEALLAWRLDLAHIDPLSFVTYTSGGNSRFPAGTPVTLHAISGHRDAYFTDCPGNALYAQLPAIAKAVATTGGPKIYSPLVQSVETQTHFTARLSVAQPWTVSIVNSSGAQVAQGTGTGTTVDWTWDASTAPPDKYTWTIATANARPATGTLGAAVALSLQNVAASPTTVRPGDVLTVNYTLSAPATVTATLVGPTGAPLSTLLTVQKPAGAQALKFTPPPGLLGGYEISITAASGTKTVTANAPFSIDDILSAFTVTPGSASFTLGRLPLSATLQVLQGTTVVAAPSISPVIGAQTVSWAPLPDGLYTVSLTITDDVGTSTYASPLTIDTTPPTVTVVSYKNMRFTVSEPATLVLIVGAQRYTRVLKKAGTTQFWLKVKPTAYRLIATDPSGNATTIRYRHAS